MLSQFGETSLEQRIQYRQFVEEKNSRKNHLVMDFKHLPQPGVVEDSVSGIAPTEEDSDLRKADGILRGVSLSLGLKGVEDLRERRKKALGRHIAMYLIRRQTLLPLRSIAELFGVKPAAVANGVGKVEKLVKAGVFPSHIKDLLKRLNPMIDADIEVWR